MLKPIALLEFDTSCLPGLTFFSILQSHSNWMSIVVQAPIFASCSSCSTCWNSAYHVSWKCHPDSDVYTRKYESPFIDDGLPEERYITPRQERKVIDLFATYLKGWYETACDLPYVTSKEARKTSSLLRQSRSEHLLTLSSPPELRSSWEPPSEAHQLHYKTRKGLCNCRTWTPSAMKQVATKAGCIHVNSLPI